jgi:hypothetical protein
MMAGPFVGQRILVECEFRYLGVPTDPNLVTVRSHAPSGSEATLTFPSTYLTRRSEGVFEASFLVNEAGTWTFRAEGAGVVDAVNEYTVAVQASGMN